MDNENIKKSKLASNLRKARLAQAEAGKKLLAAQADPKAGSKSGKARIKNRESALDKKAMPVAVAEAAVLDNDLPLGAPNPPKPRPRL